MSKPKQPGVDRGGFLKTAAVGSVATLVARTVAIAAQESITQAARR